MEASVSGLFNYVSNNVSRIISQQGKDEEPGIVEQVAEQVWNFLVGAEESPDLPVIAPPLTIAGCSYEPEDSLCDSHPQPTIFDLTISSATQDSLETEEATDAKGNSYKVLKDNPKEGEQLILAIQAETCRKGTSDLTVSVALNGSDFTEVAKDDATGYFTYTFNAPAPKTGSDAPNILTINAYDSEEKREIQEEIRFWVDSIKASDFSLAKNCQGINDDLNCYACEPAEYKILPNPNLEETFAYEWTVTYLGSSEEAEDKSDNSADPTPVQGNSDIIKFTPEKPGIYQVSVEIYLSKDTEKKNPIKVNFLLTGDKQIYPYPKPMTQIVGPNTAYPGEKKLYSVDVPAANGQTPICDWDVYYTLNGDKKPVEVPSPQLCEEPIEVTFLTKEQFPEEVTDIEYTIQTTITAPTETGCDPYILKPDSYYNPPIFVTLYKKEGEVTEVCYNPPAYKVISAPSLPSMVKGDNTLLAWVIEAWACGKPVDSYNGAAIEAMLYQSQHGFDPDNPLRINISGKRKSDVPAGPFSFSITGENKLTQDVYPPMPSLVEPQLVLADDGWITVDEKFFFSLVKGPNGVTKYAYEVMRQNEQGELEPEKTFDCVDEDGLPSSFCSYKPEKEGQHYLFLTYTTEDGVEIPVMEADFYVNKAEDAEVPCSQPPSYTIVSMTPSLLDMPSMVKGDSTVFDWVIAANACAKPIKDFDKAAIKQKLYQGGEPTQVDEVDKSIIHVSGKVRADLPPGPLSFNIFGKNNMTNTVYLPLPEIKLAKIQRGDDGWITVNEPGGVPYWLVEAPNGVEYHHGVRTPSSGDEVENLPCPSNDDFCVYFPAQEGQHYLHLYYISYTTENGVQIDVDEEPFYVHPETGTGEDCYDPPGHGEIKVIPYLGSMVKGDNQIFKWEVVFTGCTDVESIEGNFEEILYLLQSDKNQIAEELNIDGFASYEPAAKKLSVYGKVKSTLAPGSSLIVTATGANGKKHSFNLYLPNIDNPEIYTPDPWVQIGEPIAVYLKDAPNGASKCDYTAISPSCDSIFSTEDCQMPFIFSSLDDDPCQVNLVITAEDGGEIPAFLSIPVHEK